MKNLQELIAARKKAIKNLENDWLLKRLEEIQKRREEFRKKLNDITE